MNETAIRELIVSLVADCEALDLERAIYKTLLETVERHPATIENWRTIFQNLRDNPPSAVRERIGAKFLPLTELAIQGLDDVSAQALLERVRKIREESD